MPLPVEYSSDEEDNANSVNSDVFGLSSLPVAKKARVDETPSVEPEAKPDAAPHVLAEVSRTCTMAFPIS